MCNNNSLWNTYMVERLILVYEISLELFTWVIYIIACTPYVIYIKNWCSEDGPSVSAQQVLVEVVWEDTLVHVWYNDRFPTMSVLS